MKKCRVKIHAQLNPYQAAQVNLGSPIYWFAQDSNYQELFKSKDLDAVIDFANNCILVESVSKHTESWG